MFVYVAILGVAWGFSANAGSLLEDSVNVSSFSSFEVIELSYFPTVIKSYRSPSLIMLMPS